MMLDKETTATPPATAALGLFGRIQKSVSDTLSGITGKVSDVAAGVRDKIAATKKTVVETDYFVLANKVTAACVKPIDRFQQILNEANYQAEPRNIWSLLFGRKRELPETTSIEVGGKMFDGSKKVTNRFIWTAIFAAFTTHTLIMAAVVMAVVGGGLFALEYHRAKRDREDTITEINFAGQKVQGRRADLCRLHQAQISIMNLASVFRQASLESTTSTIARIMQSVDVERKRVKIIDAGPYDAMSDAYDFSRPQISLVNKDERMAALTAAHQAQIAATPTAMVPESSAFPSSAFPKADEFRSLRNSWKNKRKREDEIVDSLLALQKSLPPVLKRRLVKELQKAG